MTKRQERLAKGLCPNCGWEAAPYYLCDRCHGLEQIRRFLRKAGKHGLLDERPNPKGRRSKLWSANASTESMSEKLEYRGLDLGARAAPRLNRLPVDIEGELLGIFKRAGKPLRIDEIMAAWGRIRLRSSRESAAGDLARIINGRRKQAERRARRAARYRDIERVTT